MTQEPAMLRDRAEFLRDDWNRSIALQLRIIDWRAAAIWAAFAGVLTLAVLSTASSAIGWIGASAVIAAAVFYGFARRRRVRRLLAEMLELARQDLARMADPAPWDRSRLGTVPDYYLQPVDAQTPAQLEGMLRLSPEALKAQFAETRSAMLSVLFIGLLAFGGIFLAGLSLISWLAGAIATGRPQEIAPALFPIPVPIVAAVLAGVALVMPMAENAALVRASRTLAGYLAGAAAVELPRLWARDPSFTSGQVIRWTPTGYLLDPTKMTLAPETPARTKIVRVVLWSTAGALVLIAIGFTFLSIVLDRLLT